MGTWGVHSFDNDVARDWAGRFRVAGVDAAADTLRSVLGAKGKLEATLAAEGVAAAEALALTLGQSTAPLGAASDMGRAANSQALALLPDARKALERILEGSELRALWEEAGELTAWIESVESLRRRLDNAEAAGIPASAPPEGRDFAGLTAMELLEDLGREIARLRFDLEMLRLDLAEGVAAIRADLKAAPQ